MRFLGALLILSAATVARAQPSRAPDDAFEPRYVLEDVVVIGNRRTETALIMRELGLAPGDEVSAGDPRVETARLRLLATGYFVDVRPWLEKGKHRGGGVLRVQVEERGTIILNALHLGTSEATALWGGMEVAETNFLGRGIAVGAGFVQSTRPQVAGAERGQAFSLRAAGPPTPGAGLLLSTSLLYSDGSELYRASGRPSDPDPDDHIASRTRRLGGVVAIGTDLSRSTRLMGEGRFEGVNAELPATRTRLLPDGVSRRRIPFGVQEGSSRLAAVGVTLDVDTRSDPVLPTHGGRLALSIHTALPIVGSTYSYAKGVLQASRYFPAVRGHVLGFHAFAGAIYGDAPYFDQFFVGDLNLLLAPRALGLNFSTRGSRDFLGTQIEERRYGAYAARALVEYAIPILRRRGFVYRGDAFIAFGAFALAGADDLRVRDVSLVRATGADLTGDLGVRLDTYVGIFTLSIANALGRIPF